MERKTEQRMSLKDLSTFTEICEQTKPGESLLSGMLRSKGYSEKLIAKLEETFDDSNLVNAPSEMVSGSAILARFHLPKED